MSFSISGKTAIVTGAANGVGLAIAKHFVDQDANVMFVDRDEALLAHELSDQADRANIRYFAGDVRQRLTVSNLLSAVLDSYDRVDVLVNAARVIQPSDPLDTEDQNLDKLWQHNVMAGYRLSQIVAKQMIRQIEGGSSEREEAGSIINLSSIGAPRSRPELLAYSVSTAGLDQLTRSMALALAPHRIRVNGIAPGSVMSEALRNTIREDREARDDIRKHTPLNRIAPPSEIVHAAQYLASEASSFVTGQILEIDGGRTLLDPVSIPAH